MQQKKLENSNDPATCQYRDLVSGSRLRQFLAQSPLPPSVDMVQEFV
jgi:hypothetical protein